MSCLIHFLFAIILLGHFSSLFSLANFISNQNLIGSISVSISFLFDRFIQQVISYLIRKCPQLTQMAIRTLSLEAPRSHVKCNSKWTFYHIEIDFKVKLFMNRSCFSPPVPLSNVAFVILGVGFQVFQFRQRKLDASFSSQAIRWYMRDANQPFLRRIFSFLLGFSDGIVLFGSRIFSGRLKLLQQSQRSIKSYDIQQKTILW